MNYQFTTEMTLKLFPILNTPVTISKSEKLHIGITLCPSHPLAWSDLTTDDLPELHVRHHWGVKGTAPILPFPRGEKQAVLCV